MEKTENIDKIAEGTKCRNCLHKYNCQSLATEKADICEGYILADSVEQEKARLLCEKVELLNLVISYKHTLTDTRNLLQSILTRYGANMDARTVLNIVKTMARLKECK